MRISTIEGDAGYREDAHDLNVRITFNGRRVFNCIVADSDAGEIIVTNSKLFGFEPVAMRRDRGASDIYTYRGDVVVDVW